VGLDLENVVAVFTLLISMDGILTAPIEEMRGDVFDHRFVGREA